MNVSVCIATYNGEKYIKEQLRSILSQIDKDDEVIISDDGSTDRTLEIIYEFNDPRIKFFYSNNHNIIKNFENALQKSKGDYIFLSDQDDVWLPQKYEKSLSLLDRYDLVVSDSIVTDEKLNIVKKSFFKYFGSKKGIIRNIYRSTYFGSCMAFNRKILNYSLPFPDYKEMGHDLWIGIVAEIMGKVIFFDEPLIFYRRHDVAFVNITNKLNRSNRTLFQKINGRIIMIRCVISFYWRYKICKSV